MKNITKIMIGAGLTVAALGAAAAPATAATATEAVGTAAAGDRLQGKIHFTSRYNDANQHQYVAKLGSRSTREVVPLVGDLSKAVEFTLPAMGTTGQIEGTGVDVNKCFEFGPHNYGTWATCNGSAIQTFTLVDLPATAAGGKGPGVGISLASSPTRVFGDSSFPASGEGTYFVMYGIDSPRAMLLDTSMLAPVAGTVVPVDITGATSDAFSTISGTGEPGAEVVVTGDSGAEVCRTTVLADGTWSCVSTIELPAGSVHLTATQTAADGSVTTDDITFTVVGTPVVDPMIAGGAGLALLAAAGVFIAKRRQNATATA